MGTITPSPWKQLLLSAMEQQLDLMADLPIAPSFSEDLKKIAIESKSTLISVNIGELNHCPFAEICWYFSDSWEQFRINGRVEVIDGSNPNPEKLQGNRDRAMPSSFPQKTKAVQFPSKSLTG